MTEGEREEREVCRRRGVACARRERGRLASPAGTAAAATPRYGYVRFAGRRTTQGARAERRREDQSQGRPGDVYTVCARERAYGRWRPSSERERRYAVVCPCVCVWHLVRVRLKCL